MVKFVTVLLLLFGMTALKAEEIYKEVGDDGVPSFSDQQTSESETIKIKPPMTFETPDRVREAASSYEDIPPSHHVPRDYKLLITDPPNDTSVRENSGTLNLSVTIDPELHSTHTAELILDGSPVRTLAGSGPVTLSNLDRGTHRMNVQVVDPEGTLIDHGPAITVHMQRFAKPRPSPR